MSKSSPSVPRGRVVYAVGDVHGRLDLLRDLHSRICDDAAKRTEAAPVVVHLGDYVDRGPDSAGVIDYLSGEPLSGFEVVNLIGNHEDFLRRFLVDATVGEVWFANGGVETLESYGVAAEWSDEEGYEPVRLAFQSVFPDHHRKFIETLSLSHVEGGYAFVHAGIRPKVALSRQRTEDLLWIREEFLDSKIRHRKLIVHGHSIENEPQIRPNRIGIDTGAFATGVLTALVLEGESRDFIQTLG